MAWLFFSICNRLLPVDIFPISLSSLHADKPDESEEEGGKQKGNRVHLQIARMNASDMGGKDIFLQLDNADDASSLEDRISAIRFWSLRNSARTSGTRPKPNDNTVSPSAWSTPCSLSTLLLFPSM